MATCPTCRAHYDDAIVVCEKDGAKLLPDEAFSSADADLKPGTRVGEYEIEQKLGAGGFGSVYRARHPLIGKTAAIKVLAREFSSKPEIVARFIDEARAVNQIRHKGIIDIFSFGALPDGRHYFVMELLEGVSLEDHLRAAGPMPPQEAIPILRGVARAVDAAHAAGIAHRDLKPDNVFLVHGEDGVHTKLLDFGIAKLLGERSGQRTQTGTPIGTPHYMSPEQARGVNVTSITDVYSFGVMTYQMLTGQLPFDSEVVMDILVKHMSEAPPAPSSRNAVLPAALDKPIAHMLEKDAAARPKTLGAAVDELAAAWVATGGAAEATPSLQIAASSPGARVVSYETLGAAATEIAPPRKRRTWLVALVAVSALGAAAAIAFAVRPRADVHAAAETAKATASPLATTATASMTAPVNEQIELVVDAVPQHADVYDGPTKLGTAPGPIRMPKHAGTRKLTIKAPGFAPRDVDIDTSSSSSVSVALVAIGGGGTKPPASSTGHTISSDLEKAF